MRYTDKYTSDTTSRKVVLVVMMRGGENWWQGGVRFMNTWYAGRSITAVVHHQSASSSSPHMKQRTSTLITTGEVTILSVSAAGLCGSSRYVLEKV